MTRLKTALATTLFLALVGCATNLPDFVVRSKVVDTWIAYRADSDLSRVYEVRTFHADGTVEGSLSDQVQIYGEYHEVSRRRYTGQWKIEGDILTLFGLLYLPSDATDVVHRYRILAIDDQKAVLEDAKTCEVVVRYRQSAQQTGALAVMM
ncbi:MAG: hypothetical protein AAF578_09170 [Pseudomonadota bacterium]